MVLPDGYPAGFLFSYSAPPFSGSFFLLSSIEEILQLIHEALLFGALLVGKGVLKILEFLLLLAGEVFRHLHHDRNVLIASAAGI